MLAQGPPHGSMAATFQQPPQTASTVLCCLCGIPMAANPVNMCVNCIRSQVDITEGIQKQVSVAWCKECNRYLQPPKYWVRAELESPELLAFLLKKLKGLSRVKLVDASFVWTEPHSRRIRIKLTVQKEVLGGAILQQSFGVEFVVEPHMCLDCTRQNTNTSVWTACVQVRQHVGHKRTFFYLEQLILKHDMDAQCTNIKEHHEGVDFFFGSRVHALRFVDFVAGVVPTRHRSDKQLVSHNEHAATYNYKYTFSVEVVPLCRDDLVCLPAKAASALGGFGPLALVTRVSNTVSLTDPRTLRTVHLDANQYWRYGFKPILGSRQLVEFTVLDAEVTGEAAGKFAAADVQVAKSSDFGRNDRMSLLRTHLGRLLHAGDLAVGYDLTNTNLVDPELERAVAKGLTLPDAILVRKSYAERRKHSKRARAWKLRRMAVDPAAGDEGPSGAPGGAPGGGRAARRDGGAERGGADMERFMQELEEDPELRSKVNLYRDPHVAPAAPRGTPAAADPEVLQDASGEDMEDEEDEEEGSLPEVPVEELLDEMAALEIDDGLEGGGGQQRGGHDLRRTGSQ